MRFGICRVIGNELPPRDTTGAKLRTLRTVLAQDVGVRQIWVLNHLHNPDYRNDVVEALQNAGHSYFEISCDGRHYASLTSRRERLRYAININAARNIAIELTRQYCEFAVSLDQDCVFTPDAWTEMREYIAWDQCRNPGRMYYGLMMKRLCTGGRVTAGEMPDEEPQLVVRSDARMLFDTRRCFGDGDKAMLLHQLGYGPAPLFILYGDRCRTAGVVYHVPAGPDLAETDIRLRMQLRSESLDLLIRSLDRRYGAAPVVGE